MNYTLLNSINNPKDLKKLTPKALDTLAQEIRHFIIEVVSTKEGHLGASLGVVDLTIALHYVFDTPNDLLMWDVGHQAYGHKILTERRNRFHTNRQKGGLSGFPKISESKYDVFGTGHSSTSISAMLGMAIASKIKGDHTKHHIAVIGDASISSGMALEALNQAGVTDANLLIILNDNAMGIDPNVGAFKEHFNKLASEQTENNIFSNLQIDYHGVIDGHDIKKLIETLTQLKQQQGVRLLHVKTVKGKGLQKAEQEQTKYHAPGKFDKSTGEILQTANGTLLPPKFQDIFGRTLVELALQNQTIVGITPAMPTGSSLIYMLEQIPDRAFDVGIAEQHAVTLSAGMALQGMTVYCTIYSTFIQRAYDQIIHDVALQNIPVIFCIDRAGLVGEDGATHHGVLDIAFLRCIPNIQIFAPLNGTELRNIMYTAQKRVHAPLFIRYPRGRDVDFPDNNFKEIEFNQALNLRQGTNTAILTTGFIGNNVIKALDALDTDFFSHYHFGYVKPLDVVSLTRIFQTYKQIITVEDGTIVGGFGSGVVAFASENRFNNPIAKLGIPDSFISHGTIEELQEECGIGINVLIAFFQNKMKES
ncbi:MAG: 1-deoxy-D-xylulose-5-phosphate synthase [Bacteroidota bacterium]|nr:1-deoxy-D-xylulose-5-phosphate synthase [Bacteroidota bacterium]